MADRVRVSDLDFVYVSFKEPNKEENWADLKNKVPWAKRVDGVVGFDSAHKAAAETAETDFFISVDGDNIIVAGYREGVKMSTEKGKPITAKNYNKSIWKNNLNILSTWCTIGADIDHGKYAILGARMGCFYTVIEPNNEFFKIRDLTELEKYFAELAVENGDIDTELQLFGNSLRQQLDIPIAEYDVDDSKFYRFIMPQHINKGVQDREYQ